MIVKTRRKFIFIHIPKTAGTSISVKIKSKRYFGTSFKPHVHATLLEIKDLLGQKFDSYYSFSFVRNPWERLHSLYYFLCYKEIYKDKGENWDQKEFIKKGFKWWLMEHQWWPPALKGQGLCAQKRVQSDYLINQTGEIAVKDVFTYENLNNDLIILGKKIKIDLSNLPHEKKLNRSSYKEAYCSETIDFVATYHQKDVELFNYSFD